MDISKLETLKEKTIAGGSFAAIFDYFFDHFGEDPAFFDLGVQTRHALLESLLESVAGLLFKKKITLESLFIIRVPKTGFIHGGCVANGRMMSFFYFEDIDMGLAAITMGGGKPTQLSRFSAKRLPPESFQGKN